MEHHFHSPLKVDRTASRPQQGENGKLNTWEMGMKEETSSRRTGTELILRHRERLTRLRVVSDPVYRHGFLGLRSHIPNKVVTCSCSWNIPITHVYQNVLNESEWPTAGGGSVMTADVGGHGARFGFFFSKTSRPFQGKGLIVALVT